jgi:hypothetical protein
MPQYHGDAEEIVRRFVADSSTRVQDVRCHEISPQNSSPSGSGRCRAPGCVTHCKGVRLSDQAGAHRRRFSGWRTDRHFRGPDRRMAVAPPGAAAVAVGAFMCRLVELSQMLTDDFDHPVG